MNTEELRAILFRCIGGDDMRSIDEDVDKAMCAVEEYCNTRQSSEWVSVEDRLPDEEDFVYFCTDSGGVGMGHIDDHGICTVNYFPLRALGEVTHWMPLPQPPITESKDGQ